jgi:site-specific DNA-adenine methylase
MALRNYNSNKARWLKYSGNKYHEVKYLNNLNIPEFDTYAEPCCGSASIAFYYMNFTSGKHFILNDVNKDIIYLLEKLYNEGPDAVFNDEIWRKYQTAIRYSEKSKEKDYDRRSPPRFNSGQYLDELTFCYNLMKKHTVEFSNIDVLEFLDELPDDTFVI